MMSHKKRVRLTPLQPAKLQFTETSFFEQAELGRTRQALRRSRPREPRSMIKLSSINLTISSSSHRQIQHPDWRASMTIFPQAFLNTLVSSSQAQILSSLDLKTNKLAPLPSPMTKSHLENLKATMDFFDFRPCGQKLIESDLFRIWDSAGMDGEIVILAALVFDDLYKAQNYRSQTLAKVSHLQIDSLFQSSYR